MAKNISGENYAVKILKLLMTKGALTTTQLCDMCGCERKTVYKSMDILEINGFGLEVIAEPKKPNKYRLNGLYSAWEV